MILPEGVESKNSIGAPKTEFMKPLKNSLDAFNPRLAATRLLMYANKQLKVDMPAYTPNATPVAHCPDCTAIASQYEAVHCKVTKMHWHNITSARRYQPRDTEKKSRYGLRPRSPISVFSSSVS
jgi:hypothetical protein